jgi:hypothetical protein
MDRYVTNMAAVAVVGHAHDQAMAVAHSASTVVGLVDGSQWDWASDDDGDEAHVRKNPHASDTAWLRDDKQAVLKAY